MDGTGIAGLVDWLVSQDPITLVVVFLLVRGEVKASQLARALAVLQELYPQPRSDSKPTLRQKAPVP